MFWKLWFLICVTQLVIIKGTFDPAYSGIKTSPLHRNIESQHQETHQYERPYTKIKAYESRPSPSYGNTNYNTNTHHHNDGPPHRQHQPSHSHQQQQHVTTQQADTYQQRELPIFNRNTRVRHLSTRPSPSERTQSASHSAENTIQNYETGCPPQHTGPVPYAYDCRRFVNCWHGRGHIQSCGPGTVFNPETLECDRPDKVVCGTANANAVDVGELNKKQQITLQLESNPNKYRAGRLLDASTDNVDSLCPLGASGLVPHPTDCTKFLNCANGNTHVQSCGPGTAYSISMKVCDFKEKVDCSDRKGTGYGAFNSRDGRQYANTNLEDTDINEKLSKNEEEGDIFCPQGVSGLFPYPFDNTKFLKCKIGNTAIQNCLPGTMYSISRNYCDLKENVVGIDHVDHFMSEAQEMSSTIVSCPPSTDGIHLYPYDSTKYIKCMQGHMWIGTCAPNTVFSITTKTCRPETEVHIDDRVRNAVGSDYSIETTATRNAALNYGGQLLDCPQGQSGAYPHPFDCRKYLQCRNGKLAVETCHSGNVFSLSAKHCDPKELVPNNEQVMFQFDAEPDSISEMDYDYTDYNQGTIGLTCPEEVDGLFLHPFDCTKYLNCHGGVGQIESCKSGKVYSISRNQCINRNQVDAYDRVEYQREVQHEFSTELEQTNNQLFQNTCDSGANGAYPYPDDNTKYIKCTKGQAIVENCIKGMIFSTSRRYCDYETKVYQYDYGGGDYIYDTQNANGDRQGITAISSERKTSEGNSETEVQCPPKAEGRYPHPSDCKKFLSCSNGITHVKNCGPGTAWSVEMELCDFDSNVNCADRTKIHETTATNTISADKVTCPPKANDRFLHPFDATKFITCNNGETFIQSCPMGGVFSISRKMCLAEIEVNAVDHVQWPQDYATEITLYHNNYVVCPTHAFGYFVYPFDSGQFIRCDDGHTVIQNCEPNTLFSVSNNFCIPAKGEPARSDHDWLDSDWQGGDISYRPNPEWSLVHTTNSGVPPLNAEHSDQSLVCATSESGLHPHPTDCTKFLRCVNGISYMMDCGPGTAFNAALEVCDFKDKVDCSSIVTASATAAGKDRNSQAVACIKGASGIYPHPWDCTKFLNCDNGVANVQACGPGTAWNSKLEVCDFVANSDCSDVSGRGALPSTDSGALGYNANRSFQPSPPQPNYRGSSNTDWRARHPENNSPSHHKTGYGGQNYDNILTTPPSRATTYSDRWSSMDRQRPLPSDTVYIPESRYNPDYDRQQRLPTYAKDLHSNIRHTGWVGTGTATDRKTPTQSVTHEEGSLEPNRNYNTITSYTSPLAPFKPATKAAASVNKNIYTNNITKIYYAQPVGSEEKSEEVFDSEADSQPAANNYEPVSNKWIPIPNQVLLPPTRNTTQESDFKDSAPENVSAPTAYITPPPRRPLNSQPQNSFDSSNLYGGLQAPPPLPPINSENPLQANIYPVHPSPSRSIGRSIENIEPVRAFSTSIDGQPHLLSPPSHTNVYQTQILMTTPATYLLPPSLPTPATKTESKFTTRLSKVHPLLENTTIAMFAKDPHYSNSYSNVALASPQKSVDSENLPMADALRLLLRPYFNRSGTISEASAEKAESHIMKLTSKQPSTSNNITASPNKITKDEQEVELILAGEQDSLTTIPHSKNTKQESKPNSNWHNRGYSREFHSSHPNLLNPFDEDEYSSPHTHHRHQHNIAFHQTHPEMPNPFVTPEAPHTEPSTAINFDLSHTTQPNPYAESTTPFDISPKIDVRGGHDIDCQFDCGNGKCVKSFEVCNGINNCGNRKDEDNCKHLGYEVRLTGGESANMGRIEVKILGKWGYVCDDKFGIRDAEVVCRELGFKLGASEVRGYSYYPPTETDASFAMDEVDCRGDESSLKECNFKGWGVSNCGPDEVVGVVCKVPQLKCPNNYWLCSTSQECIPPAFVCDHTPDCADKSDESDNVCNSPIKYRMEGGRSPNEGRLEVRYRGEWGTVCDDDFGLKEAQVMCNSMGFYGLPTIVKNKYGPGNGPIWLDQVSCFGNETSLDQCSHWTWGEHNCNHTEDVGLKCAIGVPPQKVNTPKTDTINEDNTPKELDDPHQQLEDIGIFSYEWERRSKSVGTQRRCGQFKDNIIDEYAHPEERVVNGSLAKRGHHPWQATIRTRGRGGISSHWCGAVLISSRHLLTAAHCLAGYPKGAYLIRLGDHYANIAESSEIDSFIENWYVHEKFREATHMNNDIALIVLKTAVKFNDYIQPVCLPNKESSLAENRKCIISGWGSIKSGVSTPSNILRAAELPILSDEVCKQPHVYGASLTEGMFCAGYMDESVDACDGDSGGPLICHDEDGETLYGIISWGQHCGYENKPGVYVRVEKYVDWILEKINFSMKNLT